ncbi:MAG: hypothetical protein E7Z77_00665 [Methanobrevibacter sp.]|uniref:hypothetical protein n=1 Tax=Methanobrevibacter sp. TaxID=66852 RepID=UPI0025D3CF20|nr:hypothetical protein [Methanobrevibacter sp.]MBE6507903.1 hypothetical protein [Methanobrevibacter sp.]
MDIDQIKSLKFNLKIFKIKNLINELEIDNNLKSQINNYLFYLNENGNYAINEDLYCYNFSENDMLHILEGFLENLSYNLDFNLFKQKFNKELTNSFVNIEIEDNEELVLFENLSEFDVKPIECSEDTINTLISKIENDNFNQTSDNPNLLIEFKQFKESPIFKYISNDFTDYEMFKLMEKIEKDIYSDNINGEISDIVEYYLNEYSFIKKQYVLNNFLNRFIQSHSFERLVKKYQYDDDIILMILDRLKIDISNDVISDENILILKLKDYLEKECIRQDYHNQLSKLKTNIPDISKKYNLTADEIGVIFNEIETEINDYCIFDSFFGHCENKFYRQIELNQSDSRIMLNKIIKSEKIKDALLNDAQQERINDEIGELINKNKIRSNQITEELIMKKLMKVSFYESY